MQFLLTSGVGGGNYNVLTKMHYVLFLCNLHPFTSLSDTAKLTLDGLN